MNRFDVLPRAAQRCFCSECAYIQYLQLACVINRYQPLSIVSVRMQALIWGGARSLLSLCVNGQTKKSSVLRADQELVHQLE